MDPERIGPFQILEKIGSGGMGNVYLGRQHDTHRLAAVKVLSATLAREEGFVDRFNREIDAMRKLKNPHIVELFESGIEGENYYYAMEYVAGETLMSVLHRERRLPWQRAFDYAIQVCRALKAAHDAGIIHRDLKPSNLLVSPEGIVKLTDFGVAQVFAGDRITATGGIIGTAEFMSPEQAQGKRAGKQSDLYSLGAVMYAMITGRTPFMGKTAIEVIQKHKFGLFDRPRLFVPDLPARVDETVCRLLEKEPEQRFPDALVLLRHMEQTIRLEDFAISGATLSDEIDPDEVAPTVAATESKAPSTTAPPGSAPGPATLMQTLMRAELAQAGRGGYLAALFNNIYVLIALFALVILGGFWWIRPHGPALGQSSGSRDAHTPEQRQAMFDEGAALLEQSEGPEWLRARREFFEPLLQEDPETWRASVEPLLKKIAVYELTRRTAGRGGLHTKAPKSEPERLLQLALHYRQIGDLARAERMLAALDAVLAGDPDQTRLRELAEELLAEIRSQQTTGESRDELLKAALVRATVLAGAGDSAQAQKIWRGIIELYADDPAAREFVTQARAALASLKE
jgi:serine/threonine-protein kinase